MNGAKDSCNDRSVIGTGEGKSSKYVYVSICCGDALR